MLSGPLDDGSMFEKGLVGPSSLQGADNGWIEGGWLNGSMGEGGASS